MGIIYLQAVRYVETMSVVMIYSAQIASNVSAH